MLGNSNLYLILDTEAADYDRLFRVAKASLAGGVDIMQLRDKHGSAKDILKFSHRLISFLKRSIPFIINDRVDLVLESGASGVHLGQEDIPISVARRILGKKFIIGASCQTLEQARAAEAQGADYIGFGSVFKTLTKPDRKPMDLRLLAKAIETIKVPVFAIGGIGLRNISRLQDIGVERIAVCREILKSPNVKQKTALLKETLQCSCCHCHEF